MGDRNIVGKRITELRKERAMKQIELMAKLQTYGMDITAPSLSQLEGQRRLVTDMELKALADIFGVSADYLLGRTDSTTISQIEI